MMSAEDNDYAVILRDHDVVFPGVDNKGSPLELDEKFVISVESEGECVVLSLVGDVNVSVPCGLVCYDGESKEPPSRYKAEDEESFVASLENALERSSQDESSFVACVLELELGMLLAKTLKRRDDLFKIDVTDLLFRIVRAESFIIGVNDDEARMALLDQVAKIKRKRIIVDAAEDLYELGCDFRDGRDCEPDDGCAKTCFEVAAVIGNTDAQNCLGARYYEGKGVPRDYDMAFKWYAEAAKQGHVKALYNLGLCFENGRGCDSDPQKAFECYSKAAAKGFAQAKDACNRLNNLLLYDAGFPQEHTTAVTPTVVGARESKIDWGSIAVGGAAILGGVALAAIDAFMNRKK